MMENTFENQFLSDVRERAREYLKEKRYLHTLAVEEEAARIGEIYLPQKVTKLRIAALLHDITKRHSFEKQLQMCEEFGIMVNKSALASPAVLHALTGAAVAARDFADIVDEEILCAIRCHTTGEDGMSVFSTVIYLSDCTEATRTYEDSQNLRTYFWDGMPPGDDPVARAVHLSRTVVLSLDMTLRRLIENGEAIAPETVLTRNCFLARIQALMQP